MGISKMEGSAPFTMPSVIEKTPRGDVAMDVYTRLLRDRIIWLGTGITSQAANGIMAQLLYLEHDDSDDDIYMYINSSGGSIEDSMGIYDTLQFIQPDVVTICAGNSYGTATLLLAAGTPGKRFALPNAIIRLPTASDLEAKSTEGESQPSRLPDAQRKLYQLLAAHTGQSTEQISQNLGQSHYLTPQEALEYGIIDQIITRSPGL